ncbi:MAG: nickel-dependent lactate racemase [Bryobacteraceae bacterium]|nr:nickel-dependent lactate racemase [Bryobacteraceae bacterium]
MQVHLAFGKTGLEVALPEGYDYRFLEARSATPLEDASQAIAQALDAPFGRPPLVEMARGKKSVAISVCDITRPTPNRVTLPPILARLDAAGIRREDITILIATGLHRPATEAEIQEIVGPELYGTLRVVNHNARELSEHRHLGTTSTGTPVYIDERFVSAGLHITLGFIEPHLMLGFSGGRKLIAPGLAAQETIKVLHSPKFMREARAVEGSIDDNPLHRELLEISAMARHDFMLDVALARDRRIAGVFAGGGVEAHQAGVTFVRKVMLEQLGEAMDAVITTSAGYPLDLTFYQAVKGITAASHIVKPGGAILLFAACSEGAGAPEFRRMLKENPSSSDFLEKLLRTPEVEVDQWQLEKLALVMDRLRVLFHVPGLESEFHPALWGAAYPDPRQAVEALFAQLPKGARVAVIPEGPYVLAKVLEEAAA